VLRPVLDAFLRHYPDVRARLLLLDRQVSLVDEGIDIALRIAHLPDSSLVATKVGEVRRVVCAAPAYLKGRPPIRTPEDVAAHDCIAMTVFGQDAWTFPPAPGSDTPRIVRITPRLAVNTVEAALGSAVEGHGLTRLYGYQAADEVQAGRLVVVLRDDAMAQPVHLLTPEGRLSIPKVRAFTDFAVPRLRAEFTRLAAL
jgi:DNA-binding transcriptional LysR family regulator